MVQIKKDCVEVVVDPTPDVLQESSIGPGMGILYHYQPGAGQMLAEGFLRFVQTVEGPLVLVRTKENLIVGYAVIEKPDPHERWGDPSAPELWELAFIEVARGWRRRRIGSELLRACFADGLFDDRIVVATTYAWYWDLKETHLSKTEYRDALSRLLGSEGFKVLETDEPNIREDPANRLLAPIGPRVSPEGYSKLVSLLRTGPGKPSSLGKASFRFQWEISLPPLAGESTTRLTHRAQWGDS